MSCFIKFLNVDFWHVPYNLYNDICITAARFHTICRLLSHTIYLTYKHDATRIKVRTDDWNPQPDIPNVIYANVQYECIAVHLNSIILMILCKFMSHLRFKYLKDTVM